MADTGSILADLEKKSTEAAEKPKTSVMSSVNIASISSVSGNPIGRLMRTSKDGLQFSEFDSTQKSIDLPSGGKTPSVLSEMSKEERRFEILSYCTTLGILFMQGWNDGTTGPLLPTMQSHYKIGYTVVSLIFVSNCIGFVSAAIANIRMVQKLGFGTTLAIGAAMQAIGYCIQGPAPPFPVFVVAYFFSGFGLSLQAAGSLTFVVNLKHSSNKMGLLLALYGVGALVSPLVATRFSTMPDWSYHYFVSFGGTVINLIAICLVFRFRRMEVILDKAGQVVHDGASSPGGGLYKQIFGLKVVHLLAFFTLAYVGTEVSIGGWIVTFIIQERNGGTSSGYISSGFFAGLTIGRLVLLPVNKIIGERRVVFIYISVCIGLELTIWFVSSLVGNALAVAFIGFLFGPIYSIITNTAGRVIPHWLANGAIGWIGSFGQMGSALLPFITGVISSKYGVTSLQPLIVASMGMMLLLWIVVPPEVHPSA
ncbi:hypothetical protein ACEPAH_8636 [Sanghuangporus vaninii]